MTCKLSVKLQCFDLNLRIVSKMVSEIPRRKRNATNHNSSELVWIGFVGSLCHYFVHVFVINETVVFMTVEEVMSEN